MKIIRFIALILLSIAILSGCDDKHNTSHPDEGGVVLKMDWTNIESAIPSTVQALVVSSSGQNRLFDNLSGTSFPLVVDPGESMLYVYNKAEQITVFGKTATVKREGSEIGSYPGLFYSFSQKIKTERDQDIDQTAVMSRQTGELKFSIAIKPASMIAKVRTISAVLDGVASELDMQTNGVSVPSTLSMSFQKGAYYATSTIRSFGFVRSSAQNLHLHVELENGYSATVTNEITAPVASFNESKNKLYTLNATLTIADEHASSVTVGSWEINTPSRYLSVSNTEMIFSSEVSSGSLTVVTDQSNWDFSISQTGSWLSGSKADNRLTLSATQNTSSMREATVTLTAGGLSETVTVKQEASAKAMYGDKETVVFQKATVGKGIDLFLMGDGYTVSDMGKGDGKYEMDMRKAADHFFSVYPLSEFRDYFNVYMITAISKQAGISNKLTGEMVDTKFKSLWEGKGTYIDCKSDTVITYVNACKEPLASKLHDRTVIIPINVYMYAGTCIMFNNPQSPGDYAQGFTISLCPVGYYFKEIVVHEAVGHGFGKAEDEYYYTMDPIPQDEVNKIKELKKWGWYENVDFSNDILQTSWKGFAGLPKYSMVGTFEGAAQYGRGIWRPEHNSCMNNNIFYFNAPTRWAQVRRVYKLAGINYSFSQFLIDDIVPAVPSSTRKAGETFIPLARPVIIPINN